jgi:hypothetical protein
MSFKIEEIIEEFNFEKALLIMNYLDWKYHDTPVLTVANLKKVARYVLNSALQQAIEKNSINETMFSETGGFKALCTKCVEKDTDIVTYEFELIFAPVSVSSETF